MPLQRMKSHLYEALPYIEPTLNQGIKAINSTPSPRQLLPSKRQGDFLLRLTGIADDENRKQILRFSLQSSHAHRHFICNRKQSHTLPFQF